jgi:hypothetical protein
MAATVARSDSILVLMSVRLKTEEDMLMELARIRQDHDAICRFHVICDWQLNVVLTRPDLVDQWKQRMVISEISKTAQFHITVTSERFNKFAFVARFLDRMTNYDRILLKDNDQRLAGFPWISFLEHSGNATIAGPLRQDPGESLSIYMKEYSVTYPLHHGPAWKQAGSLSSFFSSIRPLSVPFIEMYLVMMRGDFAQWFFSQILTPDFVNQSVAWGPDFQWCAAARDYRSGYPACYLVPVVSTHEDTQQIAKSDEFTEMGLQVLGRFRENSTFGQWLASGRDQWNKLIKESELKDIKKKCRAKFRMKIFDIQDCAHKAEGIAVP